MTVDASCSTSDLTTAFPMPLDPPVIMKLCPLSDQRDDGAMINFYFDSLVAFVVFCMLCCERDKEKVSIVCAID